MKLSNLFKSELKMQFSSANVTAIIFIVFLLPLIPILASGEITKMSDPDAIKYLYQNQGLLIDKGIITSSIPNVGVAETLWNQLPDLVKNDIQHLHIVGISFALMAELFSQGITYALFWKIRNVLLDKSTLDRNRAIYLIYTKRQILFVKLFADMLQFLATIGVLATLVVFLIKNNGGIFTPLFYQNLLLFILGILAIYLLTSFGMRLIDSAVVKKNQKQLGLAVFMILIIGTYMAMSIVEGVVTDSAGNRIISDFIAEHKYVFSFIPILNISVIPMVLLGTIELWTIVPFLIQVVVASVIIFYPMATYQKRHLCV